MDEATEEQWVQRNFTVDRPNVLGHTDITEPPDEGGQGVLLRVVGWAIDRRCETALVNDAVSMASESRPRRPGTVIHSDDDWLNLVP